MAGLAGRLIDTFRPHPHRGDVIAAGAVVLTAALLMMSVRMSGWWEPGAMLAFFGIGGLLVFGMAMLAPLEGESPRAYHSILLLAGLVLCTGALGQLALVLGARSVFARLDELLPGGGASFIIFGAVDDLPRAPSRGALAWVATASAALAVLAAVRVNSAACTLWAAVAGSVAIVSFVDFAFAPEGEATTRWILLAVILGFAFGLAYLREHHRRHAVMLVDAAGLALITIALSFQTGLEGAYFSRSVGAPAYAGVYADGFPGFGWDLVLLLGSFGLIAYAAADREPSPGVIGAFALLIAVFVVGIPDVDGATLVGWPLFLLVVGVAGIAFGLRPRRELPPPPDAEGEAETRRMPQRSPSPDEV